METVACNLEYGHMNRDQTTLAEGMDVSHRKLSNRECIAAVEEVTRKELGSKKRAGYRRSNAIDVE